MSVHAGPSLLQGTGLTPRSLAGQVVGVTGASGFCGRVTAGMIAAAGAQVVSLGRRPGPVGEHRHWDAAGAPPDLRGVDVVVHLAAAVGDPGRGRTGAHFAAVNVTGSARLLEASGDRPVVWVSSASVYDPRLPRLGVDEEHPTAGGHLNAYGATKAAGEALALAAGARVLRPHAVYGAGDGHLLPRLRRALRAGVLTLPGEDVVLSLTAVENLSSAAAVAAAWPAGAYNVADAEPYWRDVVIARALAVTTGRRVRVRHVPVPVANVAADAAGLIHRAGLGSEPLLTRYAVDQLAHHFTLDLTRAREAGWWPHRGLDDWLTTVRAAG